MRGVKLGSERNLRIEVLPALLRRILVRLWMCARVSTLRPPFESTRPIFRTRTWILKAAFHSPTAMPPFRKPPRQGQYSWPTLQSLPIVSQRPFERRSPAANPDRHCHIPLRQFPIEISQRRQYSFPSGCVVEFSILNHPSGSLSSTGQRYLRPTECPARFPFPPHHFFYGMAVDHRSGIATLHPAAVPQKPLGTISILA